MFVLDRQWKRLGREFDPDDFTDHQAVAAIARTHKIIRICERQGVPILADLAYQGAGPWLTTGTSSPNRMTSIAKAVLTLERQR
jgi:hypothetical protein